MSKVFLLCLAGQVERRLSFAEVFGITLRFHHLKTHVNFKICIVVMLCWYPPKNTAGLTYWLYVKYY